MKTIDLRDGERARPVLWRSSRAFSLVEIVLALGIVAFTMIAIVGLIPVGASALKSSVEDTRTPMVIAQIKEQLVGLPFVAGSQGPFFFDQEGGYLGKVLGDAKNFYRVDVTLAPPTAPPPNTNLLVASLKITWPIVSTGTSPQQYLTSFYVVPYSGTGWKTFAPKVGL